MGRHAADHDRDGIYRGAARCRRRCLSRGVCRKESYTILIEINIANLAGVPSIIYAPMALGLLVYKFRLGQSVLTGGLTLAFLILPIVIVATRKALRTIPQGIRDRLMR